MMRSLISHNKPTSAQQVGCKNITQLESSFHSGACSAYPASTADTRLKAAHAASGNLPSTADVGAAARAPAAGPDEQEEEEEEEAAGPATQGQGTCPVGTCCEAYSMQDASFVIAFFEAWWLWLKFTRQPTACPCAGSPEHPGDADSTPEGLISPDRTGHAALRHHGTKDGPALAFPAVDAGRKDHRRLSKTPSSAEPAAAVMPACNAAGATFTCPLFQRQICMPLRKVRH